MIDMLLVILLVAIAGYFNVVCFSLGAKLSQAVKDNKEIKIPSIKSSLKTYREKQANHEAEKEQEMMKANLENIENYDGTPESQKQLPR